MKTPEDIKKGLECCCTDEIGKIGRHDGCPYIMELGDCLPILLKDALALIQQLEAQVPKWISVEEQEEPEEDGEYFCYGYWFGSGRKQLETAEYIGEWKIVNNFVLTHWMPLPEPPKEDEK